MFKKKKLISSCPRPFRVQNFKYKPDPSRGQLASGVEEKEETARCQQMPKPASHRKGEAGRAVSLKAVFPQL